MVRHVMPLILLLALVGCAPSTPTPSAATSVPNADVPQSVTQALELGDFTTQINNPYLPLAPGPSYILEGTVDGRPYRLERVVTTETRTITGVECIVVRDTATSNGSLIKETTGCYAQSVEGAVWKFAESVTGGESWEAGVDGAAASLAMLAFPSVGDTYQPSGTESNAEVLSISESVQITFGAFEGVLKTIESPAQQAGYAEHRYYAAGIGLVIMEIAEGGEGRIELTELGFAPPPAQ